MYIKLSVSRGRDCINQTQMHTRIGVEPEEERMRNDGGLDGLTIVASALPDGEDAFHSYA